jgi:hypothetical protein
MSHFAKVENGKVTQVIVAEQDFINTQEGTWVQTSYNTRGNVHYAPNSNTPDGEPALRGNYAGIGYDYNTVNDVFIAPQPYPSWILNQQTWLWEAPIPRPAPVEGKTFSWDEETKSWVEHSLQA